MRHENMELHNVRAVLPEGYGGAVRLCRLPEHVLPDLSPLGQENAFGTAGVELRFQMQGEPVHVTLRRDGPGTGQAEVWLGAFQHSLHAVGPEPTILTVAPDPHAALLHDMPRRECLPFSPSVVRVLLPYDYPTVLIGVEGPHAPPDAALVPARTLLTYGSSITQGASAVSPSQTYAARLARALGMDLSNVALAGAAHLEPALVDWIAHDDTWDIAVLELGINVLNADWTDIRFADAVHYFVQTTARARPGNWVFCTDVLPHHRDWEGDGRADVYRRIVRDAVQSVGLPRLMYVPARELLTGAAGLTTDAVHPSADGHAEIAARLAARIQETIAHDR